MALLRSPKPRIIRTAKVKKDKESQDDQKEDSDKEE